MNDESEIKTLTRLAQRVRRQRAIVQVRHEKWARSHRALKQSEAKLEAIMKKVEATKIVPLGHPQGGRTSAYHRKLFGERAAVALWLLLPLLAFGQQKGATLLMNLVNAPVPVTNVTVLNMPTAQIAAPPAYAYQAKVAVAWTPPPDVVAGYNLYWGTSTNQMTNIVTTPRTNLTFNVPEGVTIYVKVRAYDASGIESPDSNTILTLTGFYTDAVMGVWYVRAKGRLGATNRIQATTDFKTWTTIATFVGNGTLRTFTRTNTTQEFFLTVSP